MSATPSWFFNPSMPDLMFYTPDDVRGHAEQAIKQMKLALEAAAKLRDGDLKDEMGLIGDLASFEFLLHTLKLRYRIQNQSHGKALRKIRL